MDILRHVGLVAAIVMPLFNIPLILHIERRKSSDDISRTWVLGVFLCILVMLPSALLSPDVTFRAFGIVNTVFFGAVVAQVLRYRSHNLRRQ